MFTVSVEPWTRAQIHQLSYISVLNQHSLTILVASSPIGTDPQATDAEPLPVFCYFDQFLPYSLTRDFNFLLPRFLGLRAFLVLCVPKALSSLLFTSFLNVCPFQHQCLFLSS